MNIAIGRINNPRAAQAFCDYLKLRGVHAWCETQPEAVHILINDKAQEDFACAEMRDFLSNPNDPKYLDASWNRGESKASVVSHDTLVTGFDEFFSRAGPVTKTLVGLSILVTLVTGFGSSQALTSLLTIANLMSWDGSLSEIMSGQIWRLVTPIFLHFMLLHILFNMMWLWDLGGSVERNQSSLFLSFFVLSTAILSNLLQYLSTGPGFGGMSGVVYALLGYVWMRSLKASSGYRLNSAIIALMIVWLILGFTDILGPIGNAAHLSGLMLGVAYGLGWNYYE